MIQSHLYEKSLPGLDKRECDVHTEVELCNKHNIGCVLFKIGTNYYLCSGSQHSE